MGWKEAASGTLDPDELRDLPTSQQRIKIMGLKERLDGVPPGSYAGMTGEMMADVRTQLDAQTLIRSLSSALQRKINERNGRKN